MRDIFKKYASSLKLTFYGMWQNMAVLIFVKLLF